MSVNNQLVEQRKICPEADKGVCDKGQLWVSFEQYLADQYPNSTIESIGYRQSIGFKDGKMFKSAELTGCLIGQLTEFNG